MSGFSESLWNKIKNDSIEFEQSLDQLHRKQTGSYYTDIELAFAMMQEMVDSFSDSKKRNIMNLKFLEPCVGTGNFVFSYLRVCQQFSLTKNQFQKLINNIYVCDINQTAISIFLENLKLVAREWFDFELDVNYFTTHVRNGLIFNVDSINIKYITIQSVFDKEVAERGFDIVVTNPPYKNLKAERAHYSDDKEYSFDRQKYKEISKLAKKHFPYSSVGTLNLYKMFVEEIVDKYLNNGGISSLLIPSSILSDISCAKLRTRLLQTCNLKSIRIIEEHSKYIDSSQALCAILFHKGEKTERIHVEGSFDGSIKQDNSIPLEEIIDSATGNAILVLNSNEYMIRKCMKKHPSIRDIEYIHNMRGELDLTINKEFFQFQKTTYPFYRGRNIGYYQLIQIDKKEYAMDNFVEASSKRKYIQQERLACQQIVNMAKKRRVAFTLIPKNCVLGNSCNFISLDKNNDGVDIYFLLGILNSSLIDWFFKLTSSNNHINNYEIDNFPIPIKCKEKEEISKLVQEYLDTNDETLLVKIDGLVYRAFGIIDSNIDLVTENAHEDININTSSLFNNKELVKKAFYLDIKRIIHTITKKDCDKILDKQASVEEIGLIKKPEMTDFEKQVLQGIEKKYLKIYEGEILNHTTFKLSKLDFEMIKSVPQGGNWKNIPAETVKKSKRLVTITHTGGRTTLYGRIDYSKPSYTITTYFNRPGNGTYVHPIHERVISVREAARFQCFPDDYFFLGNKSDILKQVGNAVPPIFAYQIAKRIVEETGCTKSVDLFSGAGGLTYGFKQAGIKAVIANDIEKSACLTLKTNCPEIDVLCGDITNDVIKEQIINRGISERAEIICGGPPCQGFSMAGFRKDDDPRNQLFRQFVDIVSSVKPKIIVFENVEGLLSYKKGETYRDIIQFFSELGYLTEGRTLLMSEYGIPQRRRRVIIICTRNDLKIEPEKLYPKKITIGVEKQVTAFETISDLENIPCSETAKYESEYTSPIIKYFRKFHSIEEYLCIVSTKSKINTNQQLSLFDCI